MRRRPPRGGRVGLKPTLVVVAGPNGAGKTTLSQDLMSGDVINPDELVVASTDVSSIDAARHAVRERWRLFHAGETFSFETTLSGRREVAFIRDARKRGYSVELRYVGVESPALCRIRIAERVAKGGHDVPEHDVFRRFERSLRNLGAVLPDADSSFLYDNSTAAGITLVARFSGATVLECAPEVPRWMERALGSLLRR